MSTEIETCWVMDAAADVAERMRASAVGFLPVCNDTGEIVGTITDRDLAMRVLAERRPHGTPVHRVMSIDAVTCSPYDDLGFAEELMRRWRKSRIVCVDDRMRPVGVISLSDIAEAEYAWRAGRVLRDVSAREGHRSLHG